MFWGEYSHHLDGKGRVIVPSRFRAHLVHGAILTRGLDLNLVIYPQASWQSVVQQLNQMPITQSSARALRRLLLSGAVELNLDRQGRLLIPNHLRTYAHLDDSVLFIGMDSLIELWHPSDWQKMLDSAASTLLDADHRLMLNV